VPKAAHAYPDEVTDPSAVPQSVTTARPPLKDEQSARIRTYLITMGIRTVCFFGAVVATGWLRWTMVAFAVFLPYVAVVFANAVKPRTLNVSTNRPPVSPNRHLGG
jgi:hypothetical protein